MSAEMPAWPDRNDTQPMSPALADVAASVIVYERSLRLAWEARAREMHETLYQVAMAANRLTAVSLENHAAKALALVGPLPPIDGEG